MTDTSDRAMENALIDTVNNELAVIRSFCNAQFPCDVSSIVAVRMSRAIVSSICQMNRAVSDTHSAIFSEQCRFFLNESMTQLRQLSKQLESGLGEYSEDNLAWKTWIA